MKSRFYRSLFYTIIEKVAPLRRTYKSIELHPFSLDDNAENNPFVKEIENTGVVVAPQEEFPFSHCRKQTIITNS